MITTLERAVAGYTVRPFVAEDYIALHRLTGRKLVDDPWAVGRAYVEAGPAFTALDDRWERLGAAGLRLQWPGRAIAWAIVRPGLRSDPRAARWFHREVRRRLAELITEHGLRRVEAEAAWGDRRANKWLQRLGFTPRELAPHYGPGGETFMLYARFAPGLTDEVA